MDTGIKGGSTSVKILDYFAKHLMVSDNCHKILVILIGL